MLIAFLRKLLYNTIIGVIVVIVVLSQGYCQKPDECFVAKPLESELVDRQVVSLGKINVETIIYNSRKSDTENIAYYQKIFSAKEFSGLIQEKYGEQTFLRVQRQNWMIGVMVKPKQQQSEVTISQFQPLNNKFSSEDFVPSWQQLFDLLPKQDQPGWDLAQVPRPPESVRLLSLGSEDLAFLNYNSAKTTEELKQFYEEAMAYLGWDKLTSYSMADIVKRHSAGQKKEEILFPINDINLAALTQDGYILNYKKENTTADISIFSSAAAKKTGAIVQIRYGQTLEK
jgi:hypothetical protein